MRVAWCIRWLAGLLVVAQTVAACPCMDGLPAMGHGAVEGVSGVEMLPVRIEPRQGCQSSPGGRELGNGLVEVAKERFDTDPGRRDNWETLPKEGATGLTWSAGQKALASGPVPAPAGAPGLFLTERADGRAWTVKAYFRMGAQAEGVEDKPGAGSFQFRFAVLSPTEGLHELQALTVEIEKKFGRGYEVTPPGGEPTGLFVTDTGRHLLELRQAGGMLRVSLNGTLVSEGPALTVDGQCLLVGLSGPTTPSNQTVYLDDLELDSLPNESARQLARYGLYHEPDLPAFGGREACPAEGRPCCIVEPISGNYGAYPCSVECDGKTAYPVERFDAVDPKDAMPVLEAAIERAHKVFGCEPDPRGKADSATLLAVGPGRNEADFEGLQGARAIRYTTTDTVMYDEQGRTRFSCDLIGGRILIQMEYTDLELEEAGITAEELQILHWDGESMRPLKPGPSTATALGRLKVEGTGVDALNRTAWALVSIEDTVEGRKLNNNFATVEKSDGKIKGNGYVLGVASPVQTPGPGVEVALALLGAAFVAGAIRSRAKPPAT